MENNSEGNTNTINTNNNNQMNNNSNTNTNPISQLNSNFHNIARNHLEEIAEIQRQTNNQIQRMLTQMISTQTTANQYPAEIFEDNLHEYFFSTKILFFSPFILLLFIAFLYIEIIDMLYVLDKKSEKINIKLLESELMWIPYAILFVIIVISTWCLYLIFIKLISNFTKIKIKSFDFHIADVLYFNPFYFNMIVFYYDKKYLTTNFDLFVIMSISTVYTINFIFTNYGNYFLKIKLQSLNEIKPSEKRDTLYRMRMFYIFMICGNLITSMLINILTGYSDYIFIYMIHFKTIYLIFKQISFWYESEITYKQLDNFYATNEENHLKFNYYKSLFQIISMVI
jgi:hypothetical protein